MQKLANINTFENLQNQANRQMGAISDLSVFNSIESCVDKYVKFYDKAIKMIKIAAESLENRYHPDFSRVNDDGHGFEDMFEALFCCVGECHGNIPYGLYGDKIPGSDFDEFLLNMPEEAFYKAADPISDYLASSGSYKGYSNNQYGWLLEEYANGDYDDFDVFLDKVEETIQSNDRVSDLRWYYALDEGLLGCDYYRGVRERLKATAEQAKKEKQQQDVDVKRIFGDKNFTVSVE